MRKSKFTYKIRLTCLYCWTSQRQFRLMRCNDTTTTVTFPSPHDDAAFVVALSRPSLAQWRRLVFLSLPLRTAIDDFPASAPHARAPSAISGRLARILRLYDNALVRRGCPKACGARARAELIATPVRAAHTVPRRLERLVTPRPARLHPRPGRVLTAALISKPVFAVLRSSRASMRLTSTPIGSPG